VGAGVAVDVDGAGAPDRLDCEGGGGEADDTSSSHDVPVGPEATEKEEAGASEMGSRGDGGKSEPAETPGDGVADVETNAAGRIKARQEVLGDALAKVFATPPSPAGDFVKVWGMCKSCGEDDCPEYIEEAGSGSLCTICGCSRDEHEEKECPREEAEKADTERRKSQVSLKPSQADQGDDRRVMVRILLPNDSITAVLVGPNDTAASVCEQIHSKMEVAGDAAGPLAMELINPKTKKKIKTLSQDTPLLGVLKKSSKKEMDIGNAYFRVKPDKKASKMRHRSSTHSVQGGSKGHRMSLSIPVVESSPDASGRRTPPDLVDKGEKKKFGGTIRRLRKGGTSKKRSGTHGGPRLSLYGVERIMAEDESLHSHVTKSPREGLISPRVKELKAQEYLDSMILQRFTFEGFELLSSKSLSLAEDITVEEMKSEISTRTRIRRSDFDIFVVAPDGSDRKLPDNVRPLLRQSTGSGNSRQYTSDLIPGHSLSDLRFIVRRIQRGTQSSLALQEVAPPPLDVDIVKQFVQHLSVHGIETHGIFRINSAQKSRIKILGMAHAFSEEKKVKSDVSLIDPMELDEFSPHDVAGAFKYYLREQPDPIIPYDLRMRLMEQWKECASNESFSPDMFDSLLREVPRERLRCLRLILKLLHAIAKNATVTKMTADNLGRMFAPSILRHESNVMDVQAAQAESLIVCMLVINAYNFSRRKKKDDKKREAMITSASCLDLSEASKPDESAKEEGAEPSEGDKKAMGLAMTTPRSSTSLRQSL